jgi:hypothetical protein
MGKQKLAWGEFSLRPGLLNPWVFIFCLFLEALLPSGGDLSGEESLFIGFESSPEFPVLFMPWTLTVLADHPVPPEVTVLPPPLPSSLVLSRIRSGARLALSPLGTNRRLTAVEFLFIPQKTGPLELEPFTVSAPDKRAQSSKISLFVRENDGGRREYRPFPRWELSFRSLAAGEAGEIALRLEDWDPLKPLPALVPLPELPENGVLEKLPPAGDDRGKGIALRFRLIPLYGEEIVLKQFSFHHGQELFEVPSLRVPVLPGTPAEAPSRFPAAGASQNGTAPRDGSAGDGGPAHQGPEEGPPPFPEPGEPGFPFFRGNYRRIAGEARTLWNRGERASALAELRRNERDHPGGLFLASLRGEAERALGLELTADEKWRPKELLFLLLISGLVLLFAGLLGVKFSLSKQGRGKKAVTSGSFRSYMSVKAAALILLCLSLYGFVTRDAGSGVVLRETPVYRVPDPGGEVDALFAEGQPVKVRASAGLWALVEAPDGKSGWMFRKEIVFY